MAGNGVAATAEPALGTIGLFLPGPGRLQPIADRLAAAGWCCCLLPAPVTGMRAWLDQRFDALLIAPFGGWEAPEGMITLARSICGSRPLLVVTGADCAQQRLRALQAGADDALFAGADARELLVRLAALMRRHRVASGWLECAELRIDLIGRRVIRAGRMVPMPLREFDLLTNLARAPDRVVPRDTLLRAVWRIDFDPGTNRVEVHMSRLRAKVDRGFDWPMLVTARGHGYALCSQRGAMPNSYA